MKIDGSGGLMATRLEDVAKKFGMNPSVEPTKFVKMTANDLIQRLIHIPPGKEVGMSDFFGGGCQLITLNDEGMADGVIWDELEVDKGEQVKDSTKEHIAVVEQANENEKAVLRVAYQFMTTGSQRKGQALMNALRLKAPELYDILTGTDKDPFYNDDKLQVALDELGFKIRRFW
jgi:hypothetical protein